MLKAKAAVSYLDCGTRVNKLAIYTHLAVPMSCAFTSRFIEIFSPLMA
jgi:hypothetical protein